jgi:hypothetical protein
MATRIKLRRDTAANWLEQNPILALGEPGMETDTRMMKMGDGATRWADLKYAVTGDLQVTDSTIHGDTGVSLSSGIGNRENWIVMTNANDGDISQPDDGYSDGVAYDSLGNAYSMFWYNGGGCSLQKISPSGEVLFNNYYQQYDSYGFGLTVDRNDNIILILGEYDAGDADIVLLKLYSEDGSIMWQRSINGYGNSDDYATCVDTDANGNIFIVGSINDGSKDCYVGKFSGANGNAIWQKRYDVDGLDDTGTGVTVDKDGNLAVVGTTQFMGNFLPVFKINGGTGDIIWQAKVMSWRTDNGNYNNYNLNSSDICSDSNGDFYLTASGMSPYGPGALSIVTKFNGTTGANMWARQIGYDEYYTSVGSVICDDQNNVYVSSNIRKYKEDYDYDNSNRLTQQITKFNSTGTVIWQRWLSKEQSENIDMAQMGNWWSGDAEALNAQSIRVNKDYVLVGGTNIYQYYYGDDNQNWYLQPYVAQLNRDGAEFEVDGWSFKDSGLDIRFLTITTDVNDWMFDPASANDVDVTVGYGDAEYFENTDTTDLMYINTSRVNAVTFEEKTLTLPAGGTINVSRDKNGYITAIGTFDGSEGGNTNGDVWLNGSARDEKGNTYSAGGWYTYNTWNDWSSYENIPMVFKTDANGKLVWQAGNALDQDWSNPDLVDVAYHQATNTVVALGNDGELDGSEGFNVLYLDADTGAMKQDITHIRPSNREQDGGEDIYPRSLRVMTDGTPVVGGYINTAYDEFNDVTSGAAGLAGSGNGFLVFPRNVFVREGKTTEYPTDDNRWYVYPDGATVYKVNSFGYDESSPANTYTGTLGSGATLDVTITSGTPSIVIGNSGGSGYKAGQRIKISYGSVGGGSTMYDIYVYIDSVDGDGAITAINGTYQYTNTVDGFYPSVPTVAVAGADFDCWVEYANGTDYGITINNGGNYYGVGDTIKILGTQLGGATPDNDLIITVTEISGTGNGQGTVTGTSLSGTPQSTNIRLYAGSADYTVAGTYNIVHEVGRDGFVWTPNWSFTTGGSDSYSDDNVYGITLDTSDNVIVGGYCENTGLTGTDYSGGWEQTGFVAKFDAATGEKLWSVSVDGSEGYGDVWSVATDSKDNVYSALTSNGKWCITKLNSDGEFQWMVNHNLGNTESVSIEVTANDEILIVGEAYINQFDNDYHFYNWNVVLLKLDQDGNTLWTRALWSRQGLRFNNNDTYSGQLSINGDRFSFVGYSNDPGDDNYQGIVVDLPLDGTGVGDHGDFQYQEIELDRAARYTNNQINGDINCVTPFELKNRAFAFESDPYIEDNQWRNVTIYGNRTEQVIPVYKPEGGNITGVAKIVFEDGTEQTTTGQGLPQIRKSAMSGNDDYWLRPEDNGKHIWTQSDGYTVIIPDPDRVDLPVGFAFTIITDYWDCGVWSEDYSEDIYLSGGDGDYDDSWTIPRYSMATLVKIKDNTNGSGRWMIAGSGLTSNWW